MDAIRFGTDGWRALLGEGFTTDRFASVVEAVADSVGILYDGRLVAEGTPEALKRRAETGGARTLEDAFLELTDDDPAGDAEATADRG
jgi:ABC-2 type transport system ATP-binding protein